MRRLFLVGLLLFVVAGCRERRSFDERYRESEAKIARGANELEAELNDWNASAASNKVDGAQH